MHIPLSKQKTIIVDRCEQRLNIELDLQSLFRLLCTVLRPRNSPPPHPIWARLVSQDRRHLCDLLGEWRDELARHEEGGQVEQVDEHLVPEAWNNKCKEYHPIFAVVVICSTLPSPCT